MSPARAWLLTNDVVTVRCGGSQLPPSLVTVTLCDNQLAELRDVSQLAHLSRLEQLTVSSNPCLAQPDQVQSSTLIGPNQSRYYALIGGHLTVP